MLFKLPFLISGGTEQKETVSVCLSLQLHSCYLLILTRSFVKILSGLIYYLSGLGLEAGTL